MDEIPEDVLKAALDAFESYADTLAPQRVIAHAIMADRARRSVTYPPELLPMPDEGEEAEVAIVCPHCGKATTLQPAARQQ